jgi:transcriptional regulator with XRE-family HTH domain
MNNLRDEKMLTQFGLHLRTLRKAAKLTLEALAYEADVEISQIHRIEKGKINPTLTTLVALSNALKIDMNTLLNTERND